MQYRITYQGKDENYTETIIVSGTRALHALINYANKWNDQIISIEQREPPKRTWQRTTINQQD